MIRDLKKIPGFNAYAILNNDGKYGNNDLSCAPCDLLDFGCFL